jgi:uncharacterized protein
LIGTSSDDAPRGFRKRIGQGILTTAPYLMKLLSIAGTIAMFLVGGGILVHGVPAIHHALDSLTHGMSEMGRIGVIAGNITSMVLEGLVGLIIGTVVLLVVQAAKRLTSQSRSDGVR